MSDQQKAPGGVLHPVVDATRWEAAVGGIMAAAGPELERRARASSPVVVLARWRRPVLSSAATVALLASAALLSSSGAEEGGQGGLTGGSDLASTVSDGLVPVAVASWLGEPESVAELVQSLEEGR